MGLEEFARKNNVQIEAGYVILEENDGKDSSILKLFNDFKNIEKANIKITIDAQENIKISNLPFFNQRFAKKTGWFSSSVEKTAEVTNTQGEGKTVLEFNYTASEGEDYLFGGSLSLFQQFLLEVINIKSPDCSSPQNIHFTTDIEFQDKYGSYSVSEHREFDFNPCSIDIV